MEDSKAVKKQMLLLEKYDSICKQIKEEFKNNEEEVEIKLGEEKRSLLVHLDPLLYQSQDNIEKVYEAILYDALYDQLKRAFGYYKAIDRYKKNIQEFNDGLGNQALSFEEDKLKILEHIDDLYFARLIATGLGIMPEDVDKIVGCLIERFFAKKD